MAAVGAEWRLVLLRVAERAALRLGFRVLEVENRRADAARAAEQVEKQPNTDESAAVQEGEKKRKREESSYMREHEKKRRVSLAMPVD